jgi:hypothetical protein
MPAYWTSENPIVGSREGVTGNDPVRAGGMGGPSGIDISRPNVARVYDYLLGGKDNLAPDRELGERIMAAFPAVQVGVRAQRDVLARVVGFLVRRVQFRTRDQILALFGGLELVDPGLVLVPDWRPGPAAASSPPGCSSARTARTPSSAGPSGKWDKTSWREPGIITVCSCTRDHGYYYPQSFDKSAPAERLRSKRACLQDRCIRW